MNTQIFNYIRKIILLINAVAMICLFALVLFTPNMTVTLFSNHVHTSSMLLIFILLIISILPLSKSVAFNFFSVFALIIYSLILFKFAFQLYNWFIITNEGVIHYRFISFTKTASVEFKIQQYAVLLKETLSIMINNGMIEQVNYINKLSYVINPSLSDIMVTSLNELNVLLTNNINRALNEFELLQSMANQSSNHYNWKKIVLISICVVGVGFLFYACAQYSIYDYINKGFSISKNSSELLVEDSKVAESVSKDVVKLANLISKLTNKVKEQQKELTAIKEAFDNYKLNSNDLFTQIEATCKFMIHILFPAVLPEKDILLNLLQKKELNEVAKFVGRLPPRYYNNQN